jgi:predicted nucleic acid-binding protein
VIRLLIDTNVILDWIQKREPFFKDAQVILALIENKLVLAHFAAITISNAYYIARPSAGAAAAAELVATIRRFGQLVPLLDELIDTALLLHFRDFEDALQAASAQLIEADWIVTRNDKDFAQSPVPAITPAAIIELLQRD